MEPVARDLMESPITIAASDSTRVLADKLVETHRDGVCVLDEAGALVGVATGMDVIYQDKAVHLPTVVWLLDSPLVFGQKRTEHELEKITGQTVGDVMSKNPKTVGPDTPLRDLAALMVEGHYTILPVIDGSTLVGVVTRTGLLRNHAAAT